MAVAFRAASDTGNAASVTSRAPAVPAGAAVGDVAVVILGMWEPAHSAPTVTPPAGFVQKDTFTSDDTFSKNSVWWKRLTGADAGTYSFSFNIAFWTTAECMLFSGCAASGDPWDGVPVKNAGSWGTFGTLSLTTTDAAGGLVWACYNDSGGAHTPPTGFTETAENDCGSCAYRIPGTAGSLSAANASVASTSAAGSWLGALLSQGAATAAPPPFVRARRMRPLLVR